MLENVNINLDANALVDSLRSIGEPVVKVVMDAGIDSINAGLIRNGIIMWVFGILSLLLLVLFVYFLFNKEEVGATGSFIIMIIMLIFFFVGLYGYTQYKYSPRYMAVYKSIELMKSIK